MQANVILVSNCDRTAYQISYYYFASISNKFPSTIADYYLLLFFSGRNIVATEAMHGRTETLLNDILKSKPYVRRSQNETTKFIHLGNRSHRAIHSQMLQPVSFPFAVQPTIFI